MTAKTQHFFMPYSKAFGGPYIDDNGSTPLFLSADQAKEVLKNISDRVNIQEKVASKSEIYSLCYAVGTKQLELYSEKEKPKTVILNEKMPEINKGYYNNRLNRNIVKLKETKDIKYFYDLKECNFLLPAKVKEDSKISYAVARIERKEEEYYYLAFSSFAEYSLWPISKEWKLVEVNFNALASISHHHPYIINPMGKRLVLTIDQIKQILKGEQ